MNKVILLGRLTKEPELKSTQNGISRCAFNLAVDRRFKNANGERETDFINCTAWRTTAEFISKYFRKGQRIAIVGSIQVRSYETDSGERRYITEVIAEEAYFADGYQESKNSTNNSKSNNPNPFVSDDEWAEYNDDTELPFDL